MGLGNRRNEKCICGRGKKYKNCCGRYLEDTRNSDEKIIFFVVNGLTINYLKENNIDLCSSKPLNYFNSKSINYEKVFKYYPEIKYFLNNDNEKDDFQLIDEYYNNEIKDAATKCHFDRFLVYAFSSFQNELDKSNYFKDFQIGKFLSINKNITDSFISMNYDLLLERLLEENYVNYARSFTDEEKKNYEALLINKPHGSIDFDLSDKAIYFGDEESIWNSNINYCIANIDGSYQNILEKEKWLIPRKQVDIIAPSQYNNLLNYSWINRC